MTQITLKPIRQQTTVTLLATLTDNGVKIDWSDLSVVKAYIYSESQRVVAGPCTVQVGGEDPTILRCVYDASKPQYLGAQKLVIYCEYEGQKNTYDKAAFVFVASTAATVDDGTTVGEDTTDVDITVEDVSSSILSGAIKAALDAAEFANETAESVQERADQDHTRAEEDHSTAASDHTRAAADHTVAAADHTQAAADHSLASADHLQAGLDHTQASADHGVAVSDHGQAGQDHTRAESDHDTAASDHTKAGQDHTRAESDHTQAAADHTLAGTDHSTAAADHTQAASDHTAAAADHTLAAADHSTAAADHTQALADHQVMQGYDTRLTNVEGEVSQLGQELPLNPINKGSVSSWASGTGVSNEYVTLVQGHKYRFIINFSVAGTLGAYTNLKLMTQSSASSVKQIIALQNEEIEVNDVKSVDLVWTDATVKDYRLGFYETGAAKQTILNGATVTVQDITDDLLLFESSANKSNIELLGKKLPLNPVNVGNAPVWNESHDGITNEYVTLVKGHTYKVSIVFSVAGTLGNFAKLKLMSQDSAASVKDIISLESKTVAVNDVIATALVWFDTTVEKYRLGFYENSASGKTVLDGASVLVNDITEEQINAELNTTLSVSESQVGFKLNISNNTVVSSAAAGWFISPQIPVSDGDLVQWCSGYGSSDYTTSLAVYDSSDNVVGYVSRGNTTERRYRINNASAAYIKASFYISGDGYLCVNYYPKIIVNKVTRKSISSDVPTRIGLISLHDNTKINITSTTITIPKNTRVLYSVGRFSYSSTLSSATTLNRDSNYEQLICFNITDKTFVARTVADVKDDDYILFTIGNYSYNKNQTSLHPSMYTIDGVAPYIASTDKPSFLVKTAQELTASEQQQVKTNLGIENTSSFISYPSKSGGVSDINSGVSKYAITNADLVKGHTYEAKIVAASQITAPSDFNLKIVNSTSDSTVLRIMSLGSQTFTEKTAQFVWENDTVSNYRIGFFANGDISTYIDVYVKDITVDTAKESVITRNKYKEAALVSVAAHKGNDAIKVADKLTLLHFSDVHGNTANLSNIVEYMTHYADLLDDTIHTGDSVATKYADDDPFQSVSGAEDILNVIGNHEAWLDTSDPDYYATEKQTYDKIFAPSIANWGVTQPTDAATEGYCYYYKDYATAGFRLIVLDTVHWHYRNGTADENAEQKAWFEAVLADAKTNGLRVICATHYPPQNGITPIANTGFNVLGTTDGQKVGDGWYAADEIFGCVDDFITGGGKFHGWLMGHTHEDYIGTVYGHANQPFIIIGTSKGSGSVNNKFITGTVSQDNFNVITFETISSKNYIKVVKIGQDTDIYARSKKTICYNFTDGTLISTT